MARLFNLDIGEELRRVGAEFRSSDYLANLTQPTLGKGLSRVWGLRNYKKLAQLL